MSADRDCLSLVGGTKQCSLPIGHHGAHIWLSHAAEPAIDPNYRVGRAKAILADVEEQRGDLAVALAELLMNVDIRIANDSGAVGLRRAADRARHRLDVVSRHAQITNRVRDEAGLRTTPAGERTS